MTKDLRRKLVRSSVSVAVSLALLAFVIHYVDPQQLLEVMEHVKLSWFFLMLLSMLLFQAIRTVQFETLIVYDGSRWRLFNTLCIQSFLKMLLPFGLGELSLIYLFRSRHELGLHHGTALFIVARYLDVLVLCAIYALVLAITWNVLPAASHWIAGALLLLMLAGAAGLWILLSLRRISGRWRWRFVAHLIDHAEKVRHAMKTALSTKQLVVTFVCSTVLWVLSSLLYFTAIRALGFAYEYRISLLVLMVMDISSLLPIKGIANLGSHQASWFFALKMLNVDTQDAALVGSGSYLLVTASYLFVGLIPLVDDGMRLLRNLGPER